ncbi:unnamed protein product [Adineta steineri]|uniref:F-box domain-containing protein n=1 Tax=Adineta steineri TaxID=433720 RepID=A0A814CZA3_9BILA|nr:unnamed protein product [Adineta steineri]CAF1191054.1 unnamed protein product [Adineta steineri]
MFEKNSLTLFDHLPTEIVFEIFDYLSSNDILYGFLNLNQKYNCILLEHYADLNKFEISIKNSCFLQSILPIIQSRVEYLTITDINSCFSLDLFPNLKSVIISTAFPIYTDEITSITTSNQFRKLTTLKIHSKILNRNVWSDTFCIYQAVFYHENAFKTFELSSNLDIRVLENAINVNIQSLTIQLSYIRSTLILLENTPNLKYFDLTLSSLYPIDPLKKEFDITHIKLKKLLITLGSSINEKNFPIIAYFIKQFSSSLIHLSLNFNSIQLKENQFDGFILQRQLLNSMTQLKNFHLLVTFDKEITEIDTLLSTFQNQFWYDHHWIVGIHRQHLFTLPFHFKKLNNFIDFDEIKLSNLKTSSFLSVWPHVTSIDLSQCNNPDLNLIKQLKMNMPNLTTMILNSELINSLDTDENVALDNVSTIHCKGEYLQNIKQWLIKIVPNTKHLVLSYEPQSATSSSNRTVYLHKLDAYFRGQRTTRDYTYFLNIQHVEIKFILHDVEDIYRHVLRLVREFLEMFKNLKSFIIEFHTNFSNYNRIPFADLNKMIELLNMDRISQKYHMKHVYNYIQFIKKT